jgi:glyoxylase-like metal-dependent hydrolase (beta-lactamase superfamily II)
VGDYLREFPAAKAYGGSSGCAGKHTIVLSDGDTIKVGTLEARVLRVGGHTPDMHVLYFPAAGVLFSGDALFAGSVGGTSSPAARDEQTGAIRAKILELPDDVRVYGGHGPPTTVYIEKHHNPFLA